MRDPFKIDSPTCISFSGGRTSAYMLWRVLQSNGGLPAEAVICFANTGKEDEATLRFVRDCQERWQVPITWLEYRADAPNFAEMDFETASRDGEPFEAIIQRYGYKLPNLAFRWCTGKLKIKPTVSYLKSIGWDDEWDNFVGIRADEPRRVAKVRGSKSTETKRETRWTPLSDAGVTSNDVGQFWERQPFDLGLPNINGKTMHGNCDLCFLKPAAQIASLITEKPERAIWWARMESVARDSGTVKGDGGVFRKDRPSYAEMAKYAKQQIDMFDQAEEAVACFCGD